MKINRIYLENYRIHEKLEVEFDKGINLLLGENGKGKSSILEAIGYALFDSGLRGAKKDAIQYGKKNGKIQVEFTGVDGEEYIVTKKLNGGRTIYRKSNPELELEVKEDRIRELCGIRGDIKDVEKEIVSHWEEFSDRERVVDYLQSFKEYQELKEDMGDEFFELFDKMLEGEIGE